MRLNAEKYPVELARGSSRKYDELGLAWSRFEIHEFGQLSPPYGVVPSM